MDDLEVVGSEFDAADRQRARDDQFVLRSLVQQAPVSRRVEYLLDRDTAGRAADVLDDNVGTQRFGEAQVRRSSR